MDSENLEFHCKIDAKHKIYLIQVKFKNPQPKLVEAWCENIFLGNLFFNDLNYSWDFNHRILPPIDVIKPITLQVYHSNEVPISITLDQNQYIYNYLVITSIWRRLLKWTYLKRKFFSKRYLGQFIRSILSLIDQAKPFSKLIKKYAISKVSDKNKKKERVIFICARNLWTNESKEKLRFFEDFSNQLKEQNINLKIIHNSAKKLSNTTADVIHLKDIKLPLSFKISPELKSERLKKITLLANELLYNYTKQIRLRIKPMQVYFKIRLEYNQILFLILKYRPYIFIN